MKNVKFVLSLPIDEKTQLKWKNKMIFHFEFYAHFYIFHFTFILFTTNPLTYPKPFAIIFFVVFG